MGIAHVYSSILPLTSGAVAAGPLGGAGPTVVAGPAGTVTSSGVAAGTVGLGLGWGGLGLGWGGLGPWGGVVGPAGWHGGLIGRRWW